MSMLPPGYRFEEDRTAFDRDSMHAFLKNSYWAKGLPRDRMEGAVENSLCIAVFHGSIQIGFARAVTDYAHFAWVADVYVLSGHGGQGVAKAMIDWLHGNPKMKDVRRWLLQTQDASGLYEQLGYGMPDRLNQFMERRPETGW